MDRTKLSLNVPHSIPYNIPGADCITITHEDTNYYMVLGDQCTCIVSPNKSVPISFIHSQVVSKFYDSIRLLHKHHYKKPDKYIDSCITNALFDECADMFDLIELAKLVESMTVVAEGYTGKHSIDDVDFRVTPTGIYVLGAKMHVGPLPFDDCKRLMDFYMSVRKH